MENYTIATLKQANSQRPIICPGTPYLYFCAVIEMDFDGPDFMDPPVFDCVKTIDEAYTAIAKFVGNYNREWLIYRLGYKSPLEYLEEYRAKVA